ncbi:MAG: hypothetical protein REJ23_11755 [Brevundimonas sp.]|nr:hypothetical protein [Brevundimonas sp.]
MLNRKLAGLTALAGAFAVLVGCSKGPEIVPAKFTARPSASDIAEMYPTFARMARIPGRVKMRCEYTISGTLERCRRVAVAPEGLNFEDGVSRLLSKYTVAPQTLDGRPAPAPITFVINFDPPAAPPPYTGAPVRDADVAVIRRQLSYIGEAEGLSAAFRASRSVELDRMTAVSGFVERAFSAEGAQRRATMPLAVVQAMTPENRARLTSPSAYVMLPLLSDIEAASPEFFAANERLAAHMRNAYCAAYACSTDLPEAAAAEK